MLKTTIFRAGLLCQGLILISATGITNPGYYLSNSGHIHSDTAKINILFPMEKTVCYCLTPFEEKESMAHPAFKANPAIEKFIIKYNKENLKLFENMTEKKRHDFLIMETTLQKFELPAELKFLAFVESKLISTATSKTGARGFWQLMPATAKSFGLKITDKKDERTDCFKSTVAAARYLKQLFENFQDWLLVIAAYNGGAGTVYKAIKKSGSRDFWKLQYFLPLETRIHVKKYISTHYYFEGKGGLTTMSKKETEEHFAFAEAYINHEENILPKNSFKTLFIEESLPPNNWILIENNHNKLKLVSKI